MRQVNGFNVIYWKQGDLAYLMVSGLDEPLRFHGGLTEQRVPMLSNRRICVPEGHRLRNFDVFAVALNHVV